MEDRVLCHAGDEIDTRAETALVQVGPAPRCPSRQTEHRQGGRVFIKNDADVRDAFEGYPLESGMKMDALLQEDNVGMASQGVHPRQDIGQMLAQIVQGDPLRVVAQKM